jgi:acetyl-CoA/propionyl-CoA carboxylase biotin carboxyl carrier protein
MVAKLITWDIDRNRATARMLRALGEYEIGGLTTLVPFHAALLGTEQWARGETCRDLTEDPEWLASTKPSEAEPPSTEEKAELTEREYKVEVDGRLFGVKVIGEAVAGASGNGAAAARRPPKRERAGGGGSGATGDDLPAPLQGSIFKLPVSKGDTVAEGDLICIIEAMKMENEITAHKSGVIAELAIAEGDAVGAGDLLAKIVDE